MPTSYMEPDSVTFVSTVGMVVWFLRFHHCHKLIIIRLRAKPKLRDGCIFTCLYFHISFEEHSRYMLPIDISTGKT